MFNIANFIKIHKFSYLITIFYYNTIPLQDKKKGITKFLFHLPLRPKGIEHSIVSKFKIQVF